MGLTFTTHHSPLILHTYPHRQLTLPSPPFKVVPFFWAAMCCEAKVPGLEVPARIKEYGNNFFGAVERPRLTPTLTLTLTLTQTQTQVDSAKIMKECGGYAVAEFV